jgi:ABC-type multidrug transport system fused ATPase/permease subunit
MKLLGRKKLWVSVFFWVRTKKYNNIYKTLKLLTVKDRLKLLSIVIFQIFLSLFDLVGVIAIGALGALSIQGLQSRPAGDSVSVVLRILHIQEYEFRDQIIILGLFAAAILLLKTLISMFFTRWILFFLASKSAEFTSRLISGVLNLDLLQLQKRSTQQTLFIVSDGVRDLMIGILGTSANMASDLALLVFMICGLFYVDPIIAISVFLVFTLLAFTLHALLQVRAKYLGKQINFLQVKSNEKILEVLNSYRESFVRGRRSFYASEIGKTRLELGEIIAETNFQPYISKYAMEFTVVLGSLVLAGYQFLVSDAAHAISIIIIFLASASRITPALLRIQQGILTLKQCSGSAEITFGLINEVDLENDIVSDLRLCDFKYENFNSTIEINNVSFKYSTDKKFAIRSINLNIKSGTITAIVGPSGAGKTTLVDLLLGILEPDEGEVKISGVNPKNAIQKWPGSISYVPQSIFISMDSVRGNIGLGYPSTQIPDDRVWEALTLVKLDQMVKDLENGLDSTLGEGGAEISGGQRQRIGIARALFTKPKVLVLDEATSALDAQTEKVISDSIEKLLGQTSVIIVAHRLSTVRRATQVVYIDNGSILASGTFEEVRSLVPDFDQQAKLMGL